MVATMDWDLSGAIEDAKLTEALANATDLQREQADLLLCVLDDPFAEDRDVMLAWNLLHDLLLTH